MLIGKSATNTFSYETPLTKYDKKHLKPFIKWAGGKRRLVGELQKRMPSYVDNYCEAFIGGGALTWSLDKIMFKKIIINDYNSELINVYKMVKEQPEALLAELSAHVNTEEHYYIVRDMDRKPRFSELHPLIRAARFIFLNKTGFNGLYRVNSKGQNNVAYGKYEDPCIVDISNILACSEFLQNIEIVEGDFANTMQFLNENSFVYLDPPYAPVSKTSNFTGYTDKGFHDDTQVRLKKYCDELNAKGIKFMMTNSSASLVYDLYKDYNLEEIQASRSINCKADGRGKVKELIIRNYEWINYLKIKPPFGGFFNENLN